MKPKILIITDISFTERDYKRFGINILRKKFNVFIFDFTENFSKNLASYKFSHKIYKCKGYYSIKSLPSFIELIEKHTFSNCINYISNKPLILKLAKILKKNKIPIIKIQSGLAVMPADPRSFFQNVHILFFRLISKKQFLRLITNQIRKLRNKFIKKEPKIPYDKVVVTGKIGLKDVDIGLKTKVIYAHSYDYDNYLKNKKLPKLGIKRPYAVFLDQYLPLHPDSLVFTHLIPRCTAEKYYPALNNFFNIFEKNFNMEVIVCAHPKSDYESNENYLYGRKFIKKKTIDLVKNCNIVFAHCSTAINFSILYKKPLVLLASDEYLRSFDNFTPAIYAKKLNSPYFNIDDKNNNSKIQKIDLFKIDKKKYKIYKDDYIKYPSKSYKKFWEIFNEKI
tara:strand:- start:3531 stop:4712 length:1182 start_codon:yes stop_codon:yes gene_type:complete